MPYEYLEDGVTADVTFRARGRDLNELFAAAADATVNVMVASLDSIRPVEVRSVSAQAESLDILLMRLLEELIFFKDAEALLLRVRRVQVEHDASPPRLQADLCGEPIDPDRHERLADVKGVTLYGLSVRCDEAGWSADVTLDV